MTEEDKTSFIVVTFLAIFVFLVILISHIVTSREYCARELRIGTSFGQKEVPINRYEIIDCI